MAVTAPFCNVTVFAPAPGPVSPRGFRVLGPNATLQDVINAFNNNFSPQVQHDEFNKQLANDIGNGSKTPATSFRTVPSKNQIPKAIDDKIGKIRFKQVSIVRKKMKISNPQDEDQWVIDDRVMGMVMADRSGALWTFSDKNAGKGVAAGNEETEGAAGL